MRVLALVAGIALLVTALASTFGRRAEVGEARDRRLEAATDLLAEQVDSTVRAATAALGVATPETPIERIAAAAGFPVCAVQDHRRTCTTAVDGLLPDATFDAAVDTATGEAGVVTLAVPGTLRVTVAVAQGDRQLVVAAGLAAEDVPLGTTATLVPVAGEPLLSARTVDGQRHYATPSMVEFEGGPQAVRAVTPAAVRLPAGERGLYGVQLAIGALLALFALGGMITEHRSLQRRATTDALTGLPNRDEFTRRASEVLTRLARERATACLCIVDLDQFKVVNDTVGHEAGDRALVAAAERLQQAVRETDVVGRWGGDEFVVLMPGIVDPRAVPARAAALANAIAAAPPIGGFELAASVGAALFPAQGADLEALLRTADRAMYAAKVRGGPHDVAAGV